MSELTHRVGEMISDFTRGIFSFGSFTGIRGFGGGPRGLQFWSDRRPANENTVVNYDLTRSLYRNDGAMGLSGSFAKPIVDLQVAFMGLPSAQTGNPAQDDFLNDCIQKYWVDEIQQMFRDSIRDSKVIVRMNVPDVLDPMMTLDEAEHRTIEILPPERVDIERDGRNKNIILRALVRHRMLIVIDQGNPENGQDPITEEHSVIEIVTKDSYRFWDQTTSQWIDSMASRNPWGFVPFLEIYNEWDSSLQGGQSDLETVIPFLEAFHDVLTQSLQAHRYHSTPKLKLKLSDVGQFIQNNFPDIYDETTGRVRAGATVSWNGREIFFFQSEEDASFLEAKSVLGDSKTLLEFLIDCICIATQTPEWAFMRVDSGSANSDRNAQTVPFTKKIDKKRRNFTKPVQELLKMVLASRDMIPVRPTLSWDTIRPDDAMIESQAFQQMIMGLEAAYQSQQIDSDTYMQEIRKFLPFMGSPAQTRAGKLAPQLPAAVPVIGGPQGKNE